MVYFKYFWWWSSGLFDDKKVSSSSLESLQLHGVLRAPYIESYYFTECYSEISIELSSACNELHLG